MIQSITIHNGKKSPESYCGEVFRPGRTFKFTPGTNIIVGPNGSGKTTLLKLMESYLLCRKDTVSNASEVGNYKEMLGGKVLDGVDVVADYRNKAFRLRDTAELREGDNGFQNICSFSNLFSSYHQSRGQNGIMGIDALLRELFECKDFRFPETEGEVKDYIEKHRCEPGPVTVFLDEPDNNLDINNIIDLKAMLTTRRDDIQIICVVHNPALIYALEKSDKVNFIETKRGYLKKVHQLIENI